MSSKKFSCKGFFAAGVYKSLYTRENVSHVGIFDPALRIVSPLTTKYLYSI